jgi:hypothetical protein
MITRTLFQLAFPTSIFFFTSASSCDAGDRALTGACPEGEVCDPATEEGLHFRGAVFSESLLELGDVKTLAVGGTQLVRIFDVDDRGRHIPLDLPFDATVANGAAIVEAKHDSALVLRGAAGAEGFLRITSPASNALFDRTMIAARTIETIALAPTFTVASDSVDFLYAPGSRGVVRLSADGSALVDEGASITGTGITQHSWDSFMVGNLAPGSHTLAVRAGDRDLTTVTFEVGHADSLHEVFGSQTIQRESSGFVCFGARAGARGVHVDWSFEADNATVDESSLSGCVNLQHTGGDEVVVRAFADGLSISVTMAVEASSSKPQRAETAVAQRRFSIGNTAGDRAALRE